MKPAFDELLRVIIVRICFLAVPPWFQKPYQIIRLANVSFVNVMIAIIIISLIIISVFN